MTNDVFVDTVALLRRTFGAFEPAERRQLGVLVTTTRRDQRHDVRQRRRRRAGSGGDRHRALDARIGAGGAVTADLVPRVSDAERVRRWRLVLGGGDGDGTGARLDRDDSRIDAALGAALRLRRGTSPRQRGRGRRVGGSADRRRRCRAGSATSAGTSRCPSSRFSSATLSSASTSPICCSSPSCSPSSNLTSISSACSSSSTGCSPRRPRTRPAR